MPGRAYGYGGPDDPNRRPSSGKSQRPAYRYGPPKSVAASEALPIDPLTGMVSASPAPPAVPGYRFDGQYDRKPIAVPESLEAYQQHQYNLMLQQSQPKLSTPQTLDEQIRFQDDLTRQQAEPAAPLPPVDYAATKPQVIFPPPRPRAPRANTVQRQPLYRPGDVQRLADKLEAEQKAAMGSWQAQGGLSPSGRVYRSPTGRDASGAILGDSSGATQRYGKSPMGDWKQNYPSMQAYRKAEAAELKQQGKFRAKPNFEHNGQRVGSATVYMPSTYENSQAGYSKYRQDQSQLAQARERMLQSQAAGATALQQPIFQNAGRPLYGADLARAVREQQARYQARVQAGQQLNTHLAAGAGMQVAPQLAYR